MTLPAPDSIRSILATDCGSTTTKAILIEKRDGEYRLVVRGEAPTTVEAPFEDVTVGVRNAIQEVEELAGRRILDSGRILSPQRGDDGVDLYVSTSSAGGGLQMMVAGVVQSMSAESAQRAALGAGAIVMDVIATNDGRPPHERIRRLRQLRPDMLLLSGGVDGGTTQHVAQLAELIAAAAPRARLGAGYDLPVIYAGNVDARDLVRERLGGCTALTVTENLRPSMDRENWRPAGAALHELFLTHVMAHAPGYGALMELAHAPIMPTPGAVGRIMQSVAERENIHVVGVDIGGATTDVFSVFDGVFHRTVSANLGMSYSVSNVLAEAGVANVLRWVPRPMDEADLRNRIKNKMIRPTTIPQTLEELMVEQAIAREALRLAFRQHRDLAVGLRGRQQERTISDVFDQRESGASLVDLARLDLLVGSGGVLSHAPRRAQAALMLIDAFLPEFVTRLAVDSIFMMPQLGVLSTVHEEAARQVFRRDCLVPLGTCVAPVGTGRDGQECLRATRTSEADARAVAVRFGELARLPLAAGERARFTLEPARGFDVGAGKGRPREVEVEGGAVGLVLDARGRRPFGLPADPAARVDRLRRWNRSLEVYPEP